MDAVIYRRKRDEGEEPVSKRTRFNSLGLENEAGAGRDGRTRPARKFSGVSEDRGKNNFPVQLTTSRVGNHTRLIHTPQHYTRYERAGAGQDSRTRPARKFSGVNGGKKHFP